MSAYRESESPPEVFSADEIAFWDAVVVKLAQNWSGGSAYTASQVASGSAHAAAIADQLLALRRRRFGVAPCAVSER